MMMMMIMMMIAVKGGHVQHLNTIHVKRFPSLQITENQRMTDASRFQNKI